MYVIFAISYAVFFLNKKTVRGRRIQVASPQAAELAIMPVDIEAFRNLTDVSQHSYLREHLSGVDYRRVERQRSLAMAEYLQRVAHNASVILSLAHSSHTSQQSEVEKEIHEMASAAFSLRVFCLLALAQVYAGYLLPGVRISVGSVADGYDR